MAYPAHLCLCGCGDYMIAYAPCPVGPVEASGICEGHGGRLPSFDTQEKWDFFQEVLSREHVNDQNISKILV